MHVDLRPREWLCFLIFFVGGVASTCLESSAQAGGDFIIEEGFQPVIKPFYPIELEPQNYYLEETVRPEDFGVYEIVTRKEDVMPLLKDQWQYDTISGLRKMMPSSVISPEVEEMKSFWYPSGLPDSLKTSVELPSKRIEPVRKILKRRRGVVLPTIENEYYPKKELNNIVQHYRYLLMFNTGYVPTKKKYKKFDVAKDKTKDDFNQPGNGEPPCVMEAARICLNYNLSKCSLDTCLKLIDYDRKSEFLEISERHAMYDSHITMDLRKSVRKFLTQGLNEVLADPSRSKYEKYCAALSRVREIDSGLLHLTDERRSLLARLYGQAAALAPNAVVRHICLGKKFYMKKDWNQAWRHFELVYPKIKEMHHLVHEIAMDYYGTFRPVEGCIWLARYREVAPSTVQKRDTGEMIEKMEHMSKVANETYSCKYLYFWPVNKLPLKVYLPDTGLKELEALYKQEFEHAMFGWMRASHGKLRYVYVDKEKEADITVKFVYETKRYLKKYSKDRVPDIKIASAPAGVSWIDSFNCLGGNVRSINHSEISFYMNQGVYDEARIRELCMHEIGHTLGLVAHSRSNKALMYPWLSCGHETRGIGSEEKARLKKIYAKHPISKAAYREYILGLKAKQEKLRPLRRRRRIVLRPAS